VTEDLKYYLLQGTTTFWLKPRPMGSFEHVEEQPIMIVKGEWNGGGSPPKSKIRHMISCDAIQAICISIDGKRDELKWEQTPLCYLKNEKRRQSQIDIEILSVN